MGKFKWVTPKKKILGNMFKEAQKKIIEVLDVGIVEDLNKGVSPVYSKRMKKYSSSYRSKIAKDTTSKSRSLVNMKVSGKMHDSLSVSPSRAGISIKFDDEKAYYHNEGNKKLPRRPLLPTKKSERFNDTIMRKIIAILKNLKF